MSISSMSSNFKNQNPLFKYNDLWLANLLSTISLVKYTYSVSMETDITDIYHT